ncbi:MAG: vanadium-dependent haloperoxidase [Trueperaceae bacterium]
MRFKQFTIKKQNPFAAHFVGAHSCAPLRRKLNNTRLSQQTIKILILWLLVSQLLFVNAQSTQEPSLVVRWNEAAVTALRYKSRKVTAMARALYLVHQSMYDAWALYDDTARPVIISETLKRPLEEQTEVNKAAAVSQAAFTTLLALFPEYERVSNIFSNVLSDYGYAPYTSGNDTPEAMGYFVAREILTYRSVDGANSAYDFLDTTSEIYPKKYAYDKNNDPNTWQRLTIPTGIVRNEAEQPIIDKENLLSFQLQRFATPHWGSVEPFALTSGDQFRPGPPPVFGSDEPYRDALGETMTNDEAFRKQVEEIWKLGQSLTDDQRAIAEYWSDGPRSETPPGHWNVLAQQVSWRDNHTVDEDIKMFFALNAALLDSSIACWDAKRAYNYIRPVTAIQTLFDETWQPYQLNTFVTPPFPEYVSGHSTFSRAAAEVLTLFTDSEQFYDGVTEMQKDVNRDGELDLVGQYIAMPNSSRLLQGHPKQSVTLQWETFQEAADEAGLSRRYGGIHFQDGDLRGRELGKKVGAWVFEKAQRYWEGEEW